MTTAAPAPFQTNRPGALIWILDDDAALCELLSGQLERGGWQVSCFHDPAAFEAALAKAQPNLLVLDQMLPQRPGTQVLAKLRESRLRFPVLMLSALGAPGDRVLGLEVGADDYLAKPFLCRELQLRIEHLLQQASSRLRPTKAPQATFQIGPLQFNSTEQTLRRANGELLPLSRGDCALLGSLCSAAGQILSREDLAQASGSLVDTSQSRSLDVRISKLRRLLQEANGGIDLIESVRGRGYRLSDQVAAVPSGGEA